jgi:hypothetical protein
VESGPPLGGPRRNRGIGLSFLVEKNPRATKITQRDFCNSSIPEF